MVCVGGGRNCPSDTGGKECPSIRNREAIPAVQSADAHKKQMGQPQRISNQATTITTRQIPAHTKMRLISERKCRNCGLRSGPDCMGLPTGACLTRAAMGCSGSLTPTEAGGLGAVWTRCALLLLGGFLGMLLFCPLYHTLSWGVLRLFMPRCTVQNR